MLGTALKVGIFKSLKTTKIKKQKCFKTFFSLSIKLRNNYLKLLIKNAYL